MIRAAAVVAFALLLAGCASVQPNHPGERITLDNVEQVNDRNYTLGVEQTAVVGDPVVRLKAYQVRHLTTHATHYTVNEPCKVRIGIYWDALNPGDELPVAGKADCDTGSCTVLEVLHREGNARMGTRIDAQGRPVGAALNISFDAKLVGSASLTPSTCRFVPVEAHDAIVDKGGAYRNFEILYGGIDGQTLRFTYREYSFDDLARPAFSQAFSYPLGSATVKFKNVTLRIVDAKPDALRYVVEADGE